jgi:hypothetical protein
MADSALQFNLHEEKEDGVSENDRNKKIIEIILVSFLLLLLILSMGYYMFSYKRADLEIIKTTSQAYAQKADKFVRLEGAVKNSGKSDILDDIEVEISDNGEIIESKTIKGLKMGESIDFSKIIKGATSGSHSYAFIADSKNKIPDIDRLNNIITFDVTVPEDLPDLKVKELKFNGINLLNVTYCNEGTGASDKKFQIRVATADGIYNGNPYFPLPVPAPGECNVPYVSIDDMGVRDDRAKNVKADLDISNDIEELDEENNSFEEEVDFKKSLQCGDTDGGKNYYEKGTASTFSTGGFEDCCYNDRQAFFSLRCAAEGPFVAESYCNSYNEPKRDDIFECPKGCKDGACIK